MDEIIHTLPEDLNANVVQIEELEIASFELDEQWSYVEKRKILNGYGLFFIVLQDKF